MLDRYDHYSGTIKGAGESGLFEKLKGVLGREAHEPVEEGVSNFDGIAARPEPAVVREDAKTLSEYQVEKLLYRLKRDFIGYERIDGIKHDVNVEHLV